MHNFSKIIMTEGKNYNFIKTGSINEIRQPKIRAKQEVHCSDKQCIVQ